MNNRKVLAFILVVAMVLSSFSMAFAAEEESAGAAAVQNFSDTAAHWASAAIDKWAGYDVLKGSEGTFRPDAPITRAEMATMLDNMMDYQIAAKNSFSDVPSGAWYADAVLKANAAGILNGDGAGHATPTANITREQAALMLGRAFAVAEGTKSASKFNDSAQISSWAAPLVYGMEAAGYISGYEGKFNPKNNITRAEVVTIINNAVKAYYTEAGTYTDNVDGLAIIKVSDVIIKDAAIAGNVIVAEGVANGNVTFDGKASVKGDLVVRGGGENSIVVKGSASIQSVVVAKVDGKVRIFADGVVIGEVNANEGVILEGTFTNVTVASGAEVVIKGTVAKLDVEKAGAVDIQSGTVTTLNIVDGAKANIAASATVKTANVTGAAEIKGTGKIETANISGSGAEIAQTPGKINLASGSTANVGGKAVGDAGGAGGGGGGGGGGGTVDPEPSPSLSMNTSTLRIDGSPVQKEGDYYLIKKGWNASTELSVKVSGANFAPNTVYPMKVKAVANGGGYSVDFTANITGSAMNVTDKEITELNLKDNITGADLWTKVEDMIDVWTDNAAVGDTVVVTIQNGDTVLFTIKLKVIPTLTLDESSLRIDNSPVTKNGDYFQIKKDWTAATVLSAKVSGADFNPSTIYPMTVKATANNYSVEFNYDVKGSSMNVTDKEINQMNLIDNLSGANLWDDVQDMIGVWTHAANVGDKVVVNIQNGATILFVIKLEVIN